MTGTGRVGHGLHRLVAPVDRHAAAAVQRQLERRAGREAGVDGELQPAVAAGDGEGGGRLNRDALGVSHAEPRRHLGVVRVGVRLAGGSEAIGDLVRFAAVAGIEAAREVRAVGVRQPPREAGGLTHQPRLRHAELLHHRPRRVALEGTFQHHALAVRRDDHNVAHAHHPTSAGNAREGVAHRGHHPARPRHEHLVDVPAHAHILQGCAADLHAQGARARVEGLHEAAPGERDAHAADAGPPVGADGERFCAGQVQATGRVARTQQEQQGEGEAQAEKAGGTWAWRSHYGWSHADPLMR